MKTYAILDGNNICVSIVEVPTEVAYRVDEKCVEIPKHDVDLLHKKYRDGIWEEVDPMYFYWPLTEQETADLQMQSDLEYLVCLKELGL